MDNPITRRGVLVGVVASAAAFTLMKAATAASQPVVHDVRIKAFEFEPAHVQANIGDIIRWSNEDIAPHTATADEFGWDTGEIPSGTTREIIVVKEMQNGYFCAFHPQMKGTLDIV